MMKRTSFCLVVSVLLFPALRAGKWWREYHTGEVIVELTPDLEKAKEHWEADKGFETVRDEILRTTVIQYRGRRPASLTSKEIIKPPYEVSVRVRILEQEARYSSVSLACGVGHIEREPLYRLTARSQAQDLRYNLTLIPSLAPRSGYLYSTTRPEDGKYDRPRSITISDRYREVSPVWEEGFRIEIESALSKIPRVYDVWFELRIVATNDFVRLFKDGLLIAEKLHPGESSGRVKLTLKGNIRVQKLLLRRRTEIPDRFYTLRIDDRLNAKEIFPGRSVDTASLPPALREVSVKNIPFVFPRRGELDHIDIGKSLFHYRNQWGSFMARYTWIPPWTLDPNRIQFRIPKRPYRRLWIVATSDGDELSVPRLTARFYRPYAGFSADAKAEVPIFTAKGSVSKSYRLPVRLENGRKANLWLVPIELDSVTIASRFREEPALCLELTKDVYPYRAYPDPNVYDWFQGGLPSGVHIFAMTFEEAPVRLLSSGNRTGNVYVSPEKPIWEVEVENLCREPVSARLSLKVDNPYGEELTYRRRELHLDPLATTKLRIPFYPKVFGLHSVETTLEVDGYRDLHLTQKGTFVQLPPDTRKANQFTSRWGLWCWAGGHLTNPNEEENLYLLRAAGTRVASIRDYALRRKWGMFPAVRFILRSPAEWAFKDPYDPKEYQKFREEIGKRAEEILKENPDTQYFALFAENAISRNLTYGILPRYLGEPEYQLSEQEKLQLRARFLTAKSASEGIRKYAPRAKISFGWCEPIFSVPFMRAGYPKELMDAIGVDLPQFERMPEMPIRSVTPNRLWMLKEEMTRLGYDRLEIIHTESYFPSSHPLALGVRGSANSYVRTAVLSLALGSSRLLYCFTLHDCADYWGSQHYGCIGIIGRRPEFNPKPAFPAYATMTQLLDLVNYDHYIPTGSLSAYCVGFRSRREYIYCLWTIRGKRKAKLLPEEDSALTLVDENGNRRELDPKNPVVELTPNPMWILTEKKLKKLSLYEPLYDDSPPEFTQVLDPLDSLWKYDSAEYEKYATNHWDLMRVPGPMKYELKDSTERNSKVWRIELQKPPKERRLAAWYAVFVPPKPIEIPGKARALGIWANGCSNWGRIIYEIQDANGEIWQSVGARDQWNCDDIHSWSYFNFDGWRYIEFPLPNHLPADNYREKDTVWWNYDKEGVVDLPVKLTRIIIEMRTHHIYVTDCVPVPDRSVELDKLIAAYDDAWSMTDEPVELQRRARNLVEFQPLGGKLLPNPIQILRASAELPPTSIVKLAPPAQYYDGTRIVVTIKPIKGATEYRVYVSAYEDGAGARVMAKGAEPELLVRGFRPELPLYLFVTYLDEKGKESKPSPARRILLRDDFPMK